MHNHINFLSVAAIIYILIFIIICIYDYLLYCIENHITYDDMYIYILKPIPTSLLIVLTIVYFIIYKVHLYSLCTLVGFIFCLLGDIFLMLYPRFTNDNNFIIDGGIMFFFARICMTVSLIFYPYINLHAYKKLHISFNRKNLKKFIIIFIPTLLFSVGFGIYFLKTMKNVFKGISIFFYFLSMGLQLFLSIYRLGEFKIESMLSQGLMIVGTALFTVSDTLLLFYMYIDKFYNGDMISISLYWISMCFISSSIIRNKQYIIEKNGGYDL